MAARSQYLQYVLGQLTGLRATSRPMFGGFGLYCGDQFFGLISGDTLYFKVGDANRTEYESRRMSAFRPYRNKPDVSMTYYEVPAEFIEDCESLVSWAQIAIEVAKHERSRKK